MVILRKKTRPFQFATAATLFAACALCSTAHGPLFAAVKPATNQPGTAAKQPGTANSAPNRAANDSRGRQGGDGVQPAPNSSGVLGDIESDARIEGEQEERVTLANDPPAGFLDRFVANLGWVLILVAAVAAAWYGLKMFLGLRADSSGHPARRRTARDDTGDSLGPVVLGTGAQFPGQRDPLEGIRLQMTRMETLIDTIDRRLAVIEQRGSVDAVSPAGFGRAQASIANQLTLDRRKNPVTLPEDEVSSVRQQWSQADASVPPVPAGNPVPTNDQDLARRYNAADSAAEMQGLAEGIRAEYYSNERSGDLSALFKSEVDRFWLVPLSNRPDEALLLPGFALRKAWQKYRQFTSDHPLAYHFDLVPGDRFVLNRAARIARGPDGSWQLVSKGEVGGIL